VRDYPHLRDEVDLTPTATWGDSFITGGFRIAGSIASGALGSLVAPVAGTVAEGPKVRPWVKDWQKPTRRRGLRQDINPIS
jgi:hypothetical protein